MDAEEWKSLCLSLAELEPVSNQSSAHLDPWKSGNASGFTSPHHTLPGVTSSSDATTTIVTTSEGRRLVFSRGFPAMMKKLKSIASLINTVAGKISAGKKVMEAIEKKEEWCACPGGAPCCLVGLQAVGVQIPVMRVLKRMMQEGHVMHAKEDPCGSYQSVCFTDEGMTLFSVSPCPQGQPMVAAPRDFNRELFHDIVMSLRPIGKPFTSEDGQLLSVRETPMGPGLFHTNGNITTPLILPVPWATVAGWAFPPFFSMSVKVQALKPKEHAEVVIRRNFHGGVSCLSPVSASAPSEHSLKVDDLGMFAP